jgi:hypothetical protein
MWNSQFSRADNVLNFCEVDVRMAGFDRASKQANVWKMQRVCKILYCSDWRQMVIVHSRIAVGGHFWILKDFFSILRIETGKSASGSCFLSLLITISDCHGYRMIPLPSLAS